MTTLINNQIIRSFDPCYDPKEVGIPEDETLPVKEWVEKYKNAVKDKRDILWLLLREDFLTPKDLRLFAVWCAREALKLVYNPDPRSLAACDVAEKYANGESTKDELDNAWDAAWDAARDAARVVAWAAAWAATWAARDAAWAAALDSALDAAWAAALDAALAAQATAQAAAWDAAWDAAWTAQATAQAAALAAEKEKQIEKLLTYF